MSKTLNTVAALTVAACLGGCATGKDAVKGDKAFEEDRANIKQELLAQLGVTKEGVSSDNSAVACVEEKFGFEPHTDTGIAVMLAAQHMAEQACGYVLSNRGGLTTDDYVQVPGFSREIARTYGRESDDDIICARLTLVRGAKIEDIKCK